MSDPLDLLTVDLADAMRYHDDDLRAVAASLLADGWTPPGREITDTDELDQLPLRAAVIGDGVIRHCLGHRDGKPLWFQPGGMSARNSADVLAFSGGKVTVIPTEAAQRLSAAAPNPTPTETPTDPPTAHTGPSDHGNNPTATTHLSPDTARRQLLSPFDWPAGLADDRARRAGEHVALFLADVIDLLHLAETHDLDPGDAGEQETLRILGAIAAAAASAIGWRPPTGGVAPVNEIEAVAAAHMRDWGYTSGDILEAAEHSCTDTCERAGDAFNCLDENGISNHPIADAYAEAIGLARTAAEALAEHRPPLGYITGHRTPDGRWNIAWDGHPYTREAATDDIHEAVTEIPGVDWRVLTVLDEAGGPYLAADAAEAQQ